MPAPRSRPLSRRPTASSIPPASSLLRLQSKSHQLAEHLRGLIARGELTNPLPTSRLWSQQLGVSRRTLDEALHLIQGQGMLKITRHGTMLASAPRKTTAPKAKADAIRIVRALIFAGYQRQNFFETLSVLQERLRPRGVSVRWELCRPARLREIAARSPSLHELMLLASVPSATQRLFQQREHAAIVLGEAGPEVTLPFVNVDQAGAVRHAVFHLLQHDIRDLHLVHARLDSVGIATACAAFRTACRDWGKAPVTATLHPTRLDRPALLATGRVLTRGAQHRRGVIVLAPVPFITIATALLQHGVTIPQQTELVSLFHASEAVAIYPSFTHYRFPASRVIHYLTEATMAYFQNGEIPPMKKTLLPEMKRVS